MADTGKPQDSADSQSIGEPSQRFFYGWVIVGVMAAAGAVSMAMGALNFGLFIKPMGDELGIGRSTFGWAQSSRQVASSVTSPGVGWFLDRFGSRVMLPAAALITGGAMIALAFMDSGWHLIALFAVMGLVGMSGPGALVTSVPVLKWFVRDRGKAISFMALGMPVGAMIFVPLTQVFIDAWGWRQAWVILAILGIGVIVPLSSIFVRRQPEDMGLLPDGAKPLMAATDDESTPLPPPEDEVSWTVHDAMRTSALWRLVIVFSVLALAIGIVAVHRIPAFMDRGLDATLISLATAFDAVCAGLATFAFGMLVKHFSGRFLGSIGFALLAIASVLTIYATTTFIMFLSMAVFGLGIGGMMFLQNFIWADYFGRANVGSIRGLVMPINLAVGGIGAPIAGYVHDATGSYDTVWWVGVGLIVAITALLATTPPPQAPESSQR
ncbi:MAG: MFS transporter [SAR202 cluster bacterium]|jgi:MFS family permease|nr:MFS transporter [SAR202 cluster bacterium]MDP6716245.1 MFS transporter [SAR202 cluster bacterium]